MILKLKKYNPLYYLLILMPFIDMVIGYAFNTGTGGIITYLGQFYRIAFLCYLLYKIFFRKNNKKLNWLLLFTMYLIILTFINYYRFQSSVIENLSYTLKLLLPFYLIYGLINESEGSSLIKGVLNTYSWIYPLSLIIPRVLGIGYFISNYAFDSGYKGFYYANNELNVILMVLFVYNFDKLYRDIISYEKSINIFKINFSTVFKVLTTIVSLLLIGSKTSIIAIIIVCLAYLLKTEKSKYKLKYILIFFSIAIIGTIIVMVALNNQINNIIQRILFTYNRYISGGFLTFLLSKRNLRIQPGINYWYKNNSDGLINFLFGVGKDTKCPNDGISSDPFAMIELDLFDCLFWFGLIVTIIVLVFYISFYFQSIRVKGLFMEKVMFILVLSFSMIAGHVMMSANSGAIFAIVTANLYLQTKKIKQYRQISNASN